MGVIDEVTYLGLYTRYKVTLDNGADMTVVQQNLQTTSMDVLAARGRRAKAIWNKTHMRPLHE
jgi:putative spermidine/putrescine transport system ATP-binding protein